jgi:hypothetical protein
MRNRLTPRFIVRLSFAFVVAAVLVPAVPDVDLWGHTLFGGDIVHSRAIPTTDSYAFTSDVPWVNHEWLSEVCMYAAYMLGGGTGLVALRLALLGLLLWFVWRTLRRDGVPGESALVIVMVLALVTYPRTQHVRPQLFSLTMFAALCSALIDFDRTRAIGRLIPIPLLMLLWANLHGGFIVGFAPIGLWAVTCAFDSEAPKPVRVAPAIALVAAMAATLINPYGFGLWKFLWRTVSTNRADIDEWWSMLSAERALLVLWSTTALIAAAGIRRQERPPSLGRTGLVLVLALASFRVNRLDAFFAIASFMSFGRPLSRLLASRERTSPPKELSRAFVTATVAAAMCTAAAVLVRAQPMSNGCVDRASWMPEQDATEFVARNHLRGRMVVFFNWGEYVLWQFRHDLTISTDGRRETVYSDRQINSHLELYRGSDSGLTYFHQLNADYVWLPSQAPIIDKLRAEGWVPIYAGERSAILARPALVPSGGYVMPAARCYPGPRERTSPLSGGFWRVNS